MPTSYPGALDSFVNPASTDTQDDPPHHLQHTNANDAVEAVQAELGVNPRGAYTTVRARLDATQSFMGRVIFTASGTFAKADYPGLIAVLVKLVAGGGGSPGIPATGSGEAAASRGGGGGGYSDKIILAGSLLASETVTVGAGGTAGAINGAGGDGGTSSFGAHCEALGGSSGGAPTASSITFMDVSGLSGGTASGGDLNIPGHSSIGGFYTGGVQARGGQGGASMLGPGGRPAASNGQNGVSPPGGGYGGGAAGANSIQNTATGRPGAAGAAGIVIVELYGSQP